ncbi:MAG: COX15/CtaA family protein [Defluviicoccus sp.]|nr:COX15/CtaA family protein [Defluviicoccus sp.]MDS4072864.1 COX15/CtaA family protein [Defluviicoccus sp.]
MSTVGALAAADRKRGIAIWLFVLAGFVFLMVVLGGATRLTHSGLSMVEWRPITGWLPPLTEAEWQRTFAAYQGYPEYQKINAGMTLEAFKGIFWLEYVHRLTGRLMGVVFLLPFLIFLLRRQIDRRLGLRLAFIFLLGALQGGLGWLMVRSGMVDRPDVSQYRLVAHLTAALLIYGLILWTAFGLVATPQPAQPQAQPGPPPLFMAAVGTSVLVLLTIIWGGFVAGTDAGFAYNTFPLMDGELVPSLIFPYHPLYVNFFEDVTTIQFTHRLLATVVLTAAIGLFMASRAMRADARAHRAAGLLLLAIAAQYGLGAATVLMAVPVPLGVAHQGGAVVVWSLSLWLTFALRPGAAVTPIRAVHFAARGNTITTTAASYDSAAGAAVQREPG